MVLRSRQLALTLLLALGLAMVLPLAQARHGSLGGARLQRRVLAEERYPGERAMHKDCGYGLKSKRATGALQLQLTPEMGKTGKTNFRRLVARAADCWRPLLLATPLPAAPEWLRHVQGRLQLLKLQQLLAVEAGEGIWQRRDRQRRSGLPQDLQPHAQLLPAQGLRSGLRCCGVLRSRLHHYQGRRSGRWHQLCQRLCVPEGGKQMVQRARQQEVCPLALRPRQEVGRHGAAAAVQLAGAGFHHQQAQHLCLRHGLLFRLRRRLRQLLKGPELQLRDQLHHLRQDPRRLRDQQRHLGGLQGPRRAVPLSVHHLEGGCSATRLRCGRQHHRHQPVVCVGEGQRQRRLGAGVGRQHRRTQRGDGPLLWHCGRQRRHHLRPCCGYWRAERAAGGLHLHLHGVHLRGLQRRAAEPYSALEL